MELESDLLPTYLEAGVVLHVLALGEARFDSLRAAAGMTGGKCLAAPDVDALRDALELILEGLRPPEKMVVTRVVKSTSGRGNERDSGVVADRADLLPDGPVVREVVSGPSSGYLAAVGALAGLAVVLNLAVIALVLAARRRSEAGAVQAIEARVEPSEEVRKHGGFAELRDLANLLSNTLVDATEQAETLNLDLEDFGVSGWKREKALEGKYRNLARSVFLVIDHLELQGSGAGDNGRWIAEKLRRILEDEGIEEVSVSRGDPFDGTYHKHVGERAADLPAGSVIEVKRQGYLKKADAGRGESPVVLRQAEVVVSTGAERTGVA